MRPAPFRRAAARGCLAAALAASAGCAHKAPPLYAWNSFPRQQYETLSRNGATPEQQLLAMREQAQAAAGSGAALPPGFRGHMGLLYLQVGNVDEARAAWTSEKLAFPESATYIDQLLKRLDASPPAPVVKEKSA